MQTSNRTLGVPDYARHRRRSEQPGENILQTGQSAKEQTHALSARVVAQSAVIEFLLGLVMADKSSEATAVFTAQLEELGPPDPSIHSDLPDEFLAEVSVELNKQGNGEFNKAGQEHRGHPIIANRSSNCLSIPLAHEHTITIIRETCAAWIEFAV